MWRIPTLAEEVTHLEWASKELSIHLDRLKRALLEGELIVLDSYTWTMLENTDCHEAFDLDKADRLMQRRYGRDITPLCRKITSSQPVTAPVVLYRPQDPPWVISGDARLMVCRSLNIRPKIWKMII